MKNIKKTLLALLILLSVFVVTGCTTNDNDDNNSLTSDTVDSTTTKGNLGDDIEDDVSKGVDDVEDAIDGTTK